MEFDGGRTRTSVRLHENGYYNQDGSRNISYHETRYRRHGPRRHRAPAPTSAPAPPVDSLRPNGLLTCLFCFHIVFSLMVQAVVYQSRDVNATEEVCPIEEVCPVPEVCPIRDEAAWIRSTQQDKMPNFALLPKGAIILHRHSTRSYEPSGTFMRGFINWLNPVYLYMRVFLPTSPLIPGVCWPFQGSRGHLHILLAEPVNIEHITLGHIGKSQSPTGEITSAPKSFSVYGMNSPDGDRTLLGSYQYEEDGPAFQTFPVAATESFQHVRLEIESNWGNAEYTCLYNFRVHGQPAQNQNASVS